MKRAGAIAGGSGTRHGRALTLDKSLPVASGIGGGSADAAAALRLLTSVWRDRSGNRAAVAPTLGSDVPACLLSLPMRGEGGGDVLTPIDLSDLSGTPVLLVNPRVPLSTAEVFARWDGVDRGPLGDWREGRNDLRRRRWRWCLRSRPCWPGCNSQPGADLVRMSGSGATCFALFEDEHARDQAAAGGAARMVAPRDLPALGRAP